MIPVLVSGIATSKYRGKLRSRRPSSYPTQSLIVMLLESVVYTGDGASLR